MSIRFAMPWVIFLSLCWGPSFIFIKMAVAEIPPISLVAIRLVSAGLILLLIAKLFKIPLPKDKNIWWHCAVNGFFATAIPFVLFSYALNHTQSMIGGISNGITPMCTALLAHYYLTHEKLNMPKVFGIVLGFIGFLILLLPTILDGEIALDTYAIAACFTASFSYAVGINYAKKHLSHNQNLGIPAIQLLSTGVYLVPLAFLLENPLAISIHNTETYIALLWLSPVASVLAFVLYFHIIKVHGATVLAMVGYFIPLIAAFAGVVVLDEVMHQGIIWSTIVILASMVMVQHGTKRANQVARSDQS